MWVSRVLFVGGRDSDTRPVRPWGKSPRTASGGNLVGGFLNRNERSVRWTVATIEVAARSGIPPLRLPEALIFLRFRVFCYFAYRCFFADLQSAISVDTAGIAGASIRCLPRLTRSPRFRLTANAPLGHLSDRSPAGLQRAGKAPISASKNPIPGFSAFFREFPVLKCPL